ncbi:SixA phosphatase family protein [Arcobacter sp. FWKO B]|uniref:SixA phosphatase family protein n=1 Tax=Arcobacter sp. FWKO B TaxID=2593672 RepID=UPI0018A65B25|nr:histidine phosphatase family protein [Arcobacter sp. FWKO B]QOG12287.1 histidine phosphatase family protein [Arcobacter sp. FWKO B]
MKKLYLIRHSKSSWDNPSLDDFNRPLNSRGKKDRYLMAQYLKDNKIHPDLVLCSPALRTKKSLKAYKELLDIKESIIVFDDKLYETTSDILINSIHTINNAYNNVFLIAHNPSLNDFVNNFIPDFYDNIPTSGIVGLEFSCERWDMIDSTNCSLFLFTYPKLLNS